MTRPKSTSARRPAPVADDCEAPQRRQARDVLGQVGAADELEDHVVLSVRLGRCAKRSHALGIVTGGAGSPRRLSATPSWTAAVPTPPAGR